MWTLSSRQTPPPTVPWSKQMRVSSSRTLFAGARMSAIDVPGPAADEYCLASVTTSHTSAAERRPASARRSASRVKRCPVIPAISARLRSEYSVNSRCMNPTAKMAPHQPGRARVSQIRSVYRNGSMLTPLASTSIAAVPGGAAMKNSDATPASTGVKRASRTSVRSSRNTMTKLTRSSGSFSAATETPNTLNDSAAIQASTARM